VSVIRRFPTAAIAVTFFLVGWAWMWCTPPSDGPDEASHYVRMVGLSQGQLFGVAVADEAPLDDLFSSAPIGSQRTRLNRESGLFLLSTAAMPASACNQFDGSRPYNCPSAAPGESSVEVRSFHARTLPTSYLFPALLSKLGTTAVEKFAWGRLGYLLQGTALLAAAAYAVRPLVARRCPGVALIVLGATPLATYQLATISPSGTEWAATIAFAAVLIRLLHEPRRSWLVAFAASAALATLSRDSGVLVVPVTVCVVGIAHRERLVHLIRTRPAGPLAACAVFLCLTAAATWRLFMQAPGRTPELSASVAIDIVRHVPSLALFSVGRIGWLTTSTGLVVSAIWLLVTAAATFLAVAASRSRIATLLAIGAGWLIVNSILEVSLRPTGFGVQARYALPVLSAGILSIATIPPGQLQSVLKERRILVSAAVTSAFGHLVSMVTMIWRHTQGLWNSWPFQHPAWAPPVGWFAASIFVIVATLAILSAVMASAPEGSTLDDEFLATQ